MDNQILSVTQFTRTVKTLLELDPMLSNVSVLGEISTYKVNESSGHHYFTIKDAGAVLSCVMFKGQAAKLRFRPEYGMKVIVTGAVTVYERGGNYQLRAVSMLPDGVGDLYVAFEQLKEQLSKEGLFAQEHKKPLPLYPQRIGVITSGTGAAVRDVIRVLGKRYPLSKVIVLPVRVQGTEAPPEIVGAIRYANRYQVADVLIVGRGGGSMEDLWCFNDERVARAIYDSVIPVISAVGHEPDFTIADFVADVRAATPTQGAELAVPDQMELSNQLAQYSQLLRQDISSRLRQERRHLEQLKARRVLTAPTAYIEDRALLLDQMVARISAGLERSVAVKRQRYVAQAAKLDALSPLKVLGRGYAIAMKGNKEVIRSAAEVTAGEPISIRLKDDVINCTVVSGQE